MNTYRLRVRLGDAEFEAEGNEESVLREFQVFKGFALQVPAPRAAEHAVDSPSGNGHDPAARSAEIQVAPDEFSRVFQHDESRNLITLRFLPQGEERIAVSMLLILLGYRKLGGSNELPVTALKSALQVSGLSVERVDRDAAPSLISQQLVLKGGKGKGGRYRLTNLGISRAESELLKLVVQTA